MRACPRLARGGGSARGRRGRTPTPCCPCPRSLGSRGSGGRASWLFGWSRRRHLATSAAPPFPRSPSGASRAPPARVGVEMQRWRCRREAAPSSPGGARLPRRGCPRGRRDGQRCNARGRCAPARLPRTCANLALGEKTRGKGKALSSIFAVAVQCDGRGRASRPLSARRREKAPLDCNPHHLSPLTDLGEASLQLP